MRIANERAPAMRRVLLVAGLLLIAANLRAAITAVGPLLETIRHDLGLTAGQAGFIGALPLLTFAAVSGQVARLARRFGSDQLLWAAMLVLAAGITLRSLPVTGLLWVGTVLLGAAIAIGNVLMPSIIKRDFPDRVGTVTGVYTAAMGVFASVAAGVAVPLAGILPGGWRTSLGCWAGLALVALAVWSPRLAGRAEPEPEVRSSGRTPWRSRLAWEVSAFMALSATCFYIVLAWFPAILHSYGISETAAGWLLFVLQMLGVLMSFVVPVLLNRFADQRLIAAVSASVSMTGYIGLLAVPDLAVLWVIVAGTGIGALFVLSLTFFSLRAADADSAAALAGMGQSMGYLIAAAGPVLIGLLHDLTGGWRVPLLVLVGLALTHIAVGLRAGRDAHVRT